MDWSFVSADNSFGKYLVSNLLGFYSESQPYTAKFCARRVDMAGIAAADFYFDDDNFSAVI
jgi:hypothetical protein